MRAHTDAAYSRRTLSPLWLRPETAPDLDRHRSLCTTVPARLPAGNPSNGLSSAASPSIGVQLVGERDRACDRDGFGDRRLLGAIADHHVDLVRPPVEVELGRERATAETLEVVTLELSREQCVTTADVVSSEFPAPADHHDGGAVRRDLVVRDSTVGLDRPHAAGADDEQGARLADEPGLCSRHASPVDWNPYRDAVALDRAYVGGGCDTGDHEPADHQCGHTPDHGPHRKTLGNSLQVGCFDPVIRGRRRGRSPQQARSTWLLHPPDEPRGCLPACVPLPGSRT